MRPANLTTVGLPAYEAMRAIGLSYATATGRRYHETSNVHDPGDRKVDEFMGLAGLADWVVPATEVDRIAELLPACSSQIVDTTWFDESANIHRRLAAQLAAGTSVQVVEESSEDAIG